MRWNRRSWYHRKLWLVDIGRRCRWGVVRASIHIKLRVLITCSVSIISCLCFPTVEGFMGGDGKRKWVILNGWTIWGCWVHGGRIVLLWFLIFGPSSSLRQAVIECLIKVWWGGHGVVWSGTAQPCGYGGRFWSRCSSKLCEAGRPVGTGISKKQETGIKKQFFPQD